MAANQLAVVTGASTGIGLELARCCAQAGFNLVIAADEPQIERVAVDLRRHGGSVEPVEADLSTIEGVDKLCAAIEGAYDVAKAGFDAMMRGDSDVVTGMKNKIQTTVANVTPNEVLARQHRKMAEPGTARS